MGRYISAIKEYYMIDKLAKKRVLQISIACSVCLMLIAYMQNYFNLHSGSECGFDNPPIIACSSTLLGYFLLIFLPILLFSLITYKMRDEVFLSWKKFTFIYLFMYVCIVLISPWRPADFSPLAKDSNTFFMFYLYSIISLFFVAYKSYQLRGKK